MTATPDSIDWREQRPVELTEILRHACDCFYENGFHGTSVRDLASRVGVTVPALYYHHANKEAILAAVLAAGIADLLPYSQAAVADAGDDPVAQLTHLVECIVRHVASRSRLVALDAEYRYLGPEARAPYLEKRRALAELMRSVIQRGADQGVFVADDVTETTRALLGMLQAIARWYDVTGPLGPADLAARYVGFSLAIAGVPRSYDRK